jgi:uncharacterized membrane protein YbhN (UPF0104 family)
MSIVLRIALVAILLACAFRYGSYAGVMEHVDVRLLVAICAAQPFLFLSIAMVAIRFAALASTPPAPFAPTFKSMLLSTGLNAFLPARLSELLKVTYLHDHAGVPMTSGMAALFIERVSDVIIVGLLALASAGLLLLDSGAAVVLMVIAIAAVVTLPMIDKQLITLASRLPAHALREIAERFLSQLSQRLRDPLFYRACLFGVAAWVLSWASVAVVLHFGGSIPIGLAGGLTVFVATTLAYAVPALPAGLGIYEAAAVVALKGFGYGFDEALALALAMHVAQLAGTVLAALVILLTERTGVGTLLYRAVDFIHKPQR